jgi:predicted dehydrogenase
MRVAMVGCGYWGAKHTRVLLGLPEIDYLLLVDPNESHRVALSKSFSQLPHVPDIESALDSVDAVVIATPPRTHAELALAAIDAGKHVLVEKPLATSSMEGEQLVAAAAAASTVLMVGHTFEYNAAVRKLRDLITNDGLGRLHYIDTARLNLGLYQTDVNVLWDLAPHDISIINFLLGVPPTYVQAWGSRHAHALLEDVAFIRLNYEDLNINAHIHVSWLDPSKVRRVTVVGSGKMAVYDDLADEERIRIYDKGVVTPDQEDLGAVPMSYRYGDITSPFIDFPEPLMVQDRHFVECCQTDERPLTDGGNGVAVIRVLEAASASLRAGASAQPVRRRPRVLSTLHA